MTALYRVAMITTRDVADGYLIFTTTEAINKYIEKNDLASYRQQTANADKIELADTCSAVHQLNKMTKFGQPYLHVKPVASEPECWMFDDVRKAPALETITFALPVKKMPSDPAKRMMAEIMAVPGPG
jgi:hypothetical protein